MRKTKREILAADATGDKDRFTEKSVLLRRQREEYGKFSKTAGLLTQNQRTQVDGFGHSQASKAVWAAKKPAQNSGGSVPSAPSSQSSSPVQRTFRTKSELEKMSINQLRAETKALAKEYYSSGKSGISFGNADTDKIAEKLANGASKNALIKDYMSLKKRVSELDKSAESGIMNMITNANGVPIKIVKRTELTGEPNSITQKVNSKGGIDRNYYGENTQQSKQISNNDHGHKAESGYGEHGEHAHDYIYDDDGNLIGRPIRELTDEERKENSDIL